LSKEHGYSSISHEVAVGLISLYGRGGRKGLHRTVFKKMNITFRITPTGEESLPRGKREGSFSSTWEKFGSRNPHSSSLFSRGKGKIEIYLQEEGKGGKKGGKKKRTSRSYDFYWGAGKARLSAL